MTRASLFGRSVVAILLGLATIMIPAAVIDTALQAIEVLPRTGARRFADWQSALALSYHVLLVVAGCFVTARRAPKRPILHAMILGTIGLIMSLLGLQAIIQGDLAPAWYGWALVLLALPLAWLGGWLASR